MKITGTIVGFNLFDRVNSDISIEDPHNKGKRHKLELTRQQAQEMIDEYGTHKTVTVQIGNGEDL